MFTFGFFLFNISCLGKRNNKQVEPVARPDLVLEQNASEIENATFDIIEKVLGQAHLALDFVEADLFRKKGRRS